MIRLETRGLTLAAGGRVLCRALAVSFRAGENWAILGANGSGKTTLLHTLAGLRAPDEGAVLLDGVDLGGWRARERAQRVGLLFQDYAPTFPTTALEIALTGRHPHLGRWTFEGDDDRRRAREALEEMEVASFAPRLLATLSGGERRRVEISALLAQDPPICLLDEPTNHLDLRHCGEVLQRLARRAQQPGHLNLFVLHDVNAARRLCDHTLLLFPGGETATGRTGEIVTPGNLERVYRCPFREVRDGAERYYMPL
jgi:iron complex transport system ATP-binding protein